MNCKLELDLGSQESNKISLSFWKQLLHWPYTVPILMKKDKATCTALSKLWSNLLRNWKKEGFKISSNRVYVRLLPRRSASIEGRRHVVTVPVKLIRVQNDCHSKHVEGPFCTATIRYLEELASFVCPYEICLFISHDEKSASRRTAANKQSLLLMHVEYSVSLSDHDWVVAEKHKLILLVYAGIQIQTVS